MEQALPPPLSRWMWLGAVALGLLATWAVQRFGVDWTLNAVVLAPIAILLILVPARWLLYALVLTIPFGYPVAVLGSAVLIPPSDLLAPLVLVVLAIQRPPSPPGGLSLLVPDLLFVGFLACVIASMAVAQDLSSYWYSIKGEVIAYLIFRLTAALIIDREQVLHGLTAMALMLGTIAVIFLRWFVSAWAAGGVTTVFWERATEGTGLGWASSNALAAHVALPLPLVAAFALAPETGARRWIAVIVASGALAVVVLTSSRGAMLGLAVAVLAMFWAFRHRARLIAAAGVVLTVTAVTLVSLTPVAEMALRRFETAGADASSQARIVIWRAHVTAILERPLRGHGFDNSGMSFVMEDLQGTADAHNMLLKYAYQVGLPGLALKLAMFGWLLRLLWQRRATCRTDPALFAGFLGMMTCLAVNNVLESALSASRYQTMLSVMAGLLVAWARFTPPDRPAQAGDRPRGSSLPRHPTNTPA